MVENILEDISLGSHLAFLQRDILEVISCTTAVQGNSVRVDSLLAFVIQDSLLAFVIQDSLA